MELREPPDQQPLPRPPRSSVMEAWQQPRGSRAKAKRDSTRASPTRRVRRKPQVPKADKATQITPSFETLLKQRAASRRKKRSEDKGYGGTRPRRSTAPSPGYPKQSFSRAPRRSKVLNNLYMHLYEEVGEDEAWAVQRVEGLPKAFFIFSTLRNGRINVNDLLLTLHTLGILVTSTEMRKALKVVDIDGNGSVSFTDFLAVLNETSPFAQTEAFQNTYQAFSKMRKGMIAVDDLQPTLVSMGVALSVETLQEALTHVPVDKDGQLNVSDFLMAVSDLEHHYEDVESLDLYDTLKPMKPRREFDFDAKARVRRRTRLSFDVKYLQKADAHPLDSSLAHQEKPQQAGKLSSSQRPRFLSFQEKFPTRFDREDSLEESPKTTKRRSTQRRPPWSAGIEEDLKESLEDVESPFALEQIQKSRQSAAARGPAGTKAPERASARGQYGSDYEALQDAFEIVSKIKADYIEVGELHSTLDTMGIPLADEEFQEALQKVKLEKDGTVNFSHFMIALTNTRRFSEFSVLKDAIDAISKIEGDKVAASDLLSCVKNMGIHLSDREFQEALKLVSVDANRKVYIKDFIQGLTKSPRFSELLVAQDTIKAMSRIRGDLVDVQDLERILTNMGVHLSKAEFQEMLTSAMVDKDGRVKLEQFMTLVSKMQRFSELGALNKAINAFGQIKEDKVKISELESCLHSMGVHLSKEELEEATRSLSVSKDGTVDIKELMSALTGTRRFSNFVAVQEALRAVQHIKEDDIEVSRLATSLSTLGLRLANEVIGQVLKSARVDEAGRVKFTDFMRALSRSQHFTPSSALQDAFSIISTLEGEKIGVEDLRAVLSNLNVSLSGKEFSEALKLCDVDASGKVNLKDFIRGVTSTRRFAESVELQLTCLAISKLKDDRFDLHDLESILSNMGLQLAKETLKEVMKTASVDDNGKVNFREFITVLTQLPHFPETTVLKDTFDAMSNIKEDNIHVDALDSTLASMGILLTEEELHELLESLTIAEDGMVNFKDVMMYMTGTRRFTEFEALQDAFNALSKISGDKMEVSSLPLALEAMGIHLTPEELQEALTSSPADESGKVNVKEFMKALTKTPRFSEYVALQDAFETINKIKEDKVPVAQLEQTLNSVGVHLTKESLQEGLKTATTDDDGRVNFKDFLTSLGDTQNFSELEILQNATKALGRMQGGKIHPNDLKSTLENLGISLEDEELQKTLKAVAVDAHGTVNLKEFLTALASLQHFSDSVVLQDAVSAFSRIREDKVDLQDMDSILASLGISLASEEIQEALQKISPDEGGKVNFKEFLMNLMNTQLFAEPSAVQEALDVISKVEDDKIEVSHLESALANMGITLTKGELEEALKRATVNGDGKVNFKEFMKGLTGTKRFSRTLEMEGAVKAIGMIKEDTVDVGHLESIMREMGIHLTPEEIQKALTHVTHEEDGKVNLKDFMMALTKTRRFSQAEKDRVDVHHLDSILGNMGIYLTNEELQEALKRVTVDADGKVYLSKFLKGVRALRRFSQGEGKKVDISDLDSLLAEMGMHLTHEELQEVLKHVIVDGDGKVNVSDFTKSVISTRRASQAERDRVPTSHLDSMLGKMGIFLTEEELQEALKHTQIDAEGKVNLSEFMKSVQQLSKAEGEKVAVDNLASILANMGIHLTDEEFQKALGGVTRGADGKVDLKHFMASMMGTRRSSQWARDTVDLQNLDSILDTMGVRLTNEELQEVLKHASVDADGKVNLGEFMKGVRTVQKLPPAEEDKVDVGSLGSVLADLGIHLTQEELQEALKHSPADRNGKVDLSAFMKSVVNTRRPSQAERDTVDLQNLDSILDSMGVHLTNEEVQEVLKHVTVDADGKVNLGEFMKGVKNIQKLPSGEEDKVDVGSLGSILADLGIHLTQEELQEALKHSPADPDGRVSLRAFLKSVMDTRRPSQAERDKVDLQNLDSILDSMGVHLTNEELQEVLKHVTLEADGKVNLGEFLKGVRTVQKLPPGEENKVDVGSLGSVLADLGIHLTQEELQEALKHSPADRDGKVSLSAFMKSVMNTRRPSQAERDKVDLQNLDSILHSMGVHLTSEELREALQHATVDADGKVNLGEFMKGVRTVQKLPPREEDKVDVGSLGSVLADLGIHLTQEELQEALKHSPADRDGKVDLRAFMKSVMNTRRPSQAERDKVDLQNLDDILDRMGVHLTNEELQEALKHVTVDADGKVNLGEFMKGVRTVQKLPPGEEDKVDVGSLDSILANLGIHLTQEELQEALKHSSIDRDDRVSLSAFMRSVMDTRRPSQAERDRVDLRNLDSILAHMGIYLTNEELQEVLKFAPVDVDGKVNLSKFMQGVRTAQPMTQGPGEKVNVCELDSILASLGIHVTSEELQEALKHTTVNEDGTVNLKDFMRALNATRCLSSSRKKPQTTFGPISDINMTLKSLPKKMMLKPLPKKTSSREVSGILLDRSKCKAAKNLTRDQLEAFRYAYNFFSKDADGNIDLQGLETTAKQLGISLTEQEAYDELVYADMDGDGKVNFSDFLTIVSDNKRFIQAVAPEKGSMEDFDSVDATGILLFEVLSKLVEMSALPRKAMLEIVSYYRQKFLESTGRRAWMDAGSLMDRGKKLHKFRKAPAPPKGRVTCMSAFAGAARISVMNDKELEAYVETLRASSVPSDSPYAQVPIFPLLPNRDGMTVPKPKKDFQKLEMQRRKEPISSFENHFFHKRNWLHEATAFKPPDYFKSQKTSLSLGPHLMERRHRLTIDDLGEIRLNVKKVTEMYKQGMALKERNRMLRLWRRLHGGQIGLESGNHSFYHTFSTYSWSWNARQELVTPNELQEYDNKLYHREHSSACSDTSEVKGGKRKGNEKK